MGHDRRLAVFKEFSGDLWVHQLKQNLVIHCNDALVTIVFGAESLACLGEQGVVDLIEWYLGGRERNFEVVA